MNAIVADFTEAERELVADILQERYLKTLLPEPADSELKLDPASDDLTICPTLYWKERGAHFVVCKVADGQYRCQFFYADADHYGTGQDEYTDLRHCVLTLLRVQADHEAQSAGISSEATAAELANGHGDDEYHGPVVI
ncbi:MAG: hypothetical protein IPP88_24880 [Betaproteobacteria bacterium]|nr:hypothetical protein [Betaproteobacteria bacterium]